MTKEEEKFFTKTVFSSSEKEVSEKEKELKYYNPRKQYLEWLSERKKAKDFYPFYKNGVLSHFVKVANLIDLSTNHKAFLVDITRDISFIDKNSATTVTIPSIIPGFVPVNESLKTVFIFKNELEGISSIFKKIKKEKESIDFYNKEEFYEVVSEHEKYVLEYEKSIELLLRELFEEVLRHKIQVKSEKGVSLK